MTTRAMRGNMPIEDDVDEQEEDPLGEVPHFPKLDRVARQAKNATKALEIENKIL